MNQTRGYRLIVRRDGEAVRLFTRRGYDWTDRYPAIATAAAKVRAKSFTLDGEAVVAGADGVAMFDALHRRGRVTDAILQAFDLLELDGEDLRPLPLAKRKDHPGVGSPIKGGETDPICFQRVGPRCGASRARDQTAPKVDATTLCRREALRPAIIHLRRCLRPSKTLKPIRLSRARAPPPGLNRSPARAQRDRGH
jgi:hypothetical protein